jgi:hypothetical protein
MSEPLTVADAPSLASLPAALHPSFVHFVTRLQALDCPLAPQLAGGEGGGAVVDLFAKDGFGAEFQFASSLEALLRCDDATLHSLPCSDALQLRLSLCQWLLSRYDVDLPRAFVDLAADYADQQKSQATLGAFKRVQRIAAFLGLMPSAAAGATAPSASSAAANPAAALAQQKGLALLCGAAPPAAELSFWHALLDLICSVPSQGFHASVRQFSTAASYAVHHDGEFHKHVRLLQLISSSSAGLAADAPSSSTVQQAPQHDGGIFAPQVDLFPPTLLMTATALHHSKQQKEKGASAATQQQQPKRVWPNPAALLSQMDAWTTAMASKTRVLADLEREIPLTAHEDYGPSLARLETKLQALVQMMHQFTSAWETQFAPLADAVLAHPLHVSSLGRSLARVQDERADLTTLLAACKTTARNYASILSSRIRNQMEQLGRANSSAGGGGGGGAPRPDDRTTLRLTETRKVFEASCTRLQAQLDAYKEAQARAKAAEPTLAASRAIRLQQSQMRMRKLLGDEEEEEAKSQAPQPTPALAPSSSPASSSSFAPGSSLSAALLSHSQSSTRGPSSSGNGGGGSILSSSVDLASGARESVGHGSAGMFSPVRASPLPQRLVTRTGAPDVAWSAAREAEAERSQREHVARDAALRQRADEARPPEQRALFNQAQMHDAEARASPEAFTHLRPPSIALATTPAASVAYTPAASLALHASVQQWQQQSVLAASSAPSSSSSPSRGALGHATINGASLSQASLRHLHALGQSTRPAAAASSSAARLTADQLR